MSERIQHLICAATTAAATYGLLLQDLIGIFMSLAGGAISFAIFISGRLEARRLLKDSQRRTLIIESLAKRLATCPTSKQSEVLSELVEYYKEDSKR